ncbi:MAG TPA: M24 family metallopeptidase, partial [Thermoanaerobaculia bacterium]|nr:M24 family metallopeptidase [Thermoanaerobaculia bacterium]
MGNDGADPRLRELWAGLEERGCEALLVLAQNAQDSDLAPFTGHAHIGECLLVVPRGGAPRLAYFTPMERDEAAGTGLDRLTPEELEVSRWQDERPEPADFLAAVAGRALDRAGIRPGRVALAGHGSAGTIQGACASLAREGWEWVPGNTLVRLFRKRKSAQELAAIRAAADATCAAMRHVAARLAAADERDGVLWLEGERLTVARLRAELAQVLAARGMEQPRGNILAPGEEGGVPHSTGTPDRALRSGEPIVVDLFPHGELFADCTRTFCRGTPPEPVARAYDAVERTLQAAYRAAADGVRGWSLQEEVCRIFQEAGYPTPISHPGTTHGYVHNLGHGVGFDLHEYPSFRKSTGAEGVLRQGDVFTL